MNTDTTPIMIIEKESTEGTIYLEFEHYLFEVYLNDHIKNEILRMMEYIDERTSDLIIPLPAIDANLKVVCGPHSSMRRP
jgi:hypothetical protein